MNSKFLRFERNLAAVFAGWLLLLAGRDAVVAGPVVTFSPFTNDLTVANLSAIGGTVSNDLPVTAMVFSIRELDIHGGPGRWWNGAGFQSSPARLPATVTGTNWTPDSGVALPALNPGQRFELTATATDSATNSGTAQIF